MACESALEPPENFISQLWNASFAWPGSFSKLVCMCVENDL